MYGDAGASDSSRTWEILAEHVQSLITAWESGHEPPELADFLPAEPPHVRRLTLVELIKVDMEYRWQQPTLVKTIDQYAEQFPDLLGNGVPADLIYEEYHIRRQVGDNVSRDEYLERFPDQADELRRLLGLEGPHISTALFSTEKHEDVNVGDTLDDFELLAQLGKGAFATVFLARQNSLQRLVALKVSSDRGTEAQTLAQLDHPHIVRVYDQRLLPARKLRLLYMQYIAGGTLQPVVEYIRQLPPTERNGSVLLKVLDRSLDLRGASPPSDSPVRQQIDRSGWAEVVCWLGARLALALDYAHRHGVLHRDVKPANVMLAADATPKLVDFNISFSSKLDGATPAAYFGGSLAYMSPEQLEASNPAHQRTPEQLDGRSDIYSLAVMLWELLTGRRPFPDESLQSGWKQLLACMAARRHEGVPPEAIDQLPARLPPGLKDVLLKCLAPDPNHRYATAGELARQLELCLQPQVERLMRPRSHDWRQRARRWALPILAAGGVLPNSMVSGFNILYNVQGIVGNMSPAAQQVFFSRQLLIVNLILYSVGLYICLALSWSVITAIRKHRRGISLETDDLPTLRARCLRLGAYVFYVSVVLWIVSSVLFPGWLRVQLGPEEGLGLSAFLHFFVSQVLCGLLSGTMCFFFVTFFCVRVYYPLLVVPETVDRPDVDDLTRLGRRVWRFVGVAIAMPLLGIAALFTFLVAEPGGQEQLFWVFGTLSIVGVVVLFLSLGVATGIQSDLSALTLAIRPAGEVLPTPSEQFESFWTGSKR